MNLKVCYFSRGNKQDKKLIMILNLEYKIPKEYKKSTNSIYSWVHFSIRRKISHYYHWLVFADCQELVSKFWQIQDKVNLNFKFYWKSRYLDSSNCSFIAKMIEDWLVRGWLIIEDNNKHIWKVSFESILMNKKERKHLEFDKVEIFIEKE